MKKTLKIVMLLTLVFCLCLALAGCATAAEDGIAVTPIGAKAAELALDILATAAMAAIGVAGAWLAAKAGQNKKLTSISQAINQTILAAQLTVGELQQTMVEAMKAAAKDGKLTPAQIATLKVELQTKTRAKLADPVLQMLEASKTDVNALIQGAAEDLINQMHAATPVLIGQPVAGE